MKPLNLWTTLAVLFAAMTLGPGCLVVSGGEDGECYEYEVCETYCDQFECWEECWWQEAQSCGEPVGAQACSSDVECGGSLICVGDVCQSPETQDQGLAGLCQACESHADCAGDGAKCLLLNESTDGSGERVCGQVCDQTSDCPADFACVNIGSGEAQCMPQIREGVRTCLATADLECTTAVDCAPGESCVENVCTPPEGSQCQADADCEAGDICRNFACVADDAPECVDRTDCASGEVCVDGSCEGGTQGCVFSSECSADGKCINGQCQSVCTGDEECGPNEACRAGICRVLECRRTADCAAGTVCVDSTCKPQCTGPTECGQGFVCSELGYCEEDPTVECRTGAECARDEICASGSCQTPCTCNQDCATGDVCNLDNGLCEPASADAPTACEDSCDCPSGQMCEGGTCG